MKFGGTNTLTTLAAAATATAFWLSFGTTANAFTIRPNPCLLTSVKPIPTSVVTSLWYTDKGKDETLTSSSSSSSVTTSNIPPPPVDKFVSPVLQQLFPALMQHKEQYGNPNIPLGNSDGRKCNTLRRLHIQNKLTQDEIDWLTDIGFTFHSLEDVYRVGDFDDLFQRMMKYESQHPESNFQIPKKCVEDPELGAWVTGIRRLGPDGVNPQHERQLNQVGFVWKSTRQCGSKFMKQYRDYVAMVDDGTSGEELLQSDPNVVRWVQAQQLALRQGKLSQTRVHYMEQLFGENWTTIGK